MLVRKGLTDALSPIASASLEAHPQSEHMSVEPDIWKLHSGIGNMEQSVIDGVGSLFLEIF